MAQHTHKWGLITDGPDCDECEYAATLGLAYCKCGETIGPTEIERRLAATERLGADKARKIGRAGPRGELELPDLTAYAAALESQ